MKHYYIVGIVIVVLFSIGFLIRPLCVFLGPHTPETDRLYRKRTERSGYIPLFQEQENGWYQCKMWVDRKLFF